MLFGSTTANTLTFFVKENLYFENYKPHFIKLDRLFGWFCFVLNTLACSPSSSG